MSPHDLTVGCAYYRVTYADPQLTIPGVEPIIFVGVDTPDSEGGTPEPIYSFQHTVSFSKFGNAATHIGPENLSDRGVFMYSFTATQLNMLVDLAGAAEALNDAVERAHWKER